MAAAMITLVMLVYALILARMENPHGLGKLSVIAAHYVAPPLYLAWWIMHARGDTLSLRDIPLMLVPSLAYMAYVLAYGCRARLTHTTGRDTVASNEDANHVSGRTLRRRLAAAPSVNCTLPGHLSFPSSK
jgi:hypothetical protein